MTAHPLVAVIGSGEADADRCSHARAVGAAVARAGATLVCGGLGGVMEAACRGANDVLGPGSGRIVGVLPGVDPDAANGWVDVPIATGMGTARNVVLVLSARAVLVVGGESGTLSEIAHAWQLGRPIAAYVPAGGWGARVAGTAIDDRRTDTVEPLAEPIEVERWIARVVFGD